MKLVSRKLLTIITEANLEAMLIRDIEKLGATGYTLSEVTGKGSKGIRKGDWSENRNMRFEVVCDIETAEKILDHLVKKYYENFAMIAFLEEVQVLRGEKFH